MGKKAKVGKQRRDKYYQLAKETGYRSRAAFKLIQLNRKFEFLQRSKVLIDLCAAPGGWLQVAQKFMPVSSVIVGVDLVPIKPIHNVITLQEDITTSKCRSSLRKTLQNWKADVVLHDGAPNVGKSWLHDAFEQNRLTLSALHLACDFLMKGGCFVTKVFRSKDYNSLLWVFNKLFKRVFATKPQASRNESAEIFVVCQKFLAPTKIEPELFDPNHVFAETKDEEHKITANDLLRASTKMKKAKAEGYEDGEITLYHKLPASKFIADSNYAEMLAKVTEIVLDNDYVGNHPATTEEIRECFKDVKVLGRKELMLMINWRRTLRNDMKKEAKEAKKVNGQLVAAEDDGGCGEESVPVEQIDQDDDEDDEETLIEKEDAIKAKRQKRKEEKERKKMEERMRLKMIIKNDQLVQEEQDLFSLSKLKRKSGIVINDVAPDEVMGEDDDDDPDNGDEIPVKRNRLQYDKDLQERFFDPEDDDDDDDEGEELKPEVKYNNNQQEEEEEEEEENELLVDLEDKESKVERMTERFFENKMFHDSDGNDDDEDDDEIELQEIENTFFPKDRTNNSVADPPATAPEPEMPDSEDETETPPEKEKEPGGVLSAEELALGSMMIRSRKSKRDLTDGAWNRYMHGDIDDAPAWFNKEERIYCRRPTPVTDEQRAEYTRKLSEIKSKPIKKEMEAKARKKKRTLRRLEKARLKAENLTDDPSMSNKEKADTIRRIYRKATTKQDKRPQLVVARKQYGNRRPPGVKGRYKIVDGRMKKDQRRKKAEEKKKGGGKKAPRKPQKQQQQQRKNNFRPKKQGRRSRK